MKILVLYYSAYGHINKLAQAIGEGIKRVKGAEAVLKRVPETLSEELLGKLGVLDAQKSFSSIPVCTVEELPSYDAIIFGTPTRFGNMCGQMRQFLDGLGGLWSKDAFVGKAAGVFTSSNTQHGGQESTLLSFHITLLHLGFVIAGLPYSFKGQFEGNEISGCSPYGASTIAGNNRMPSQNELEGARYQGEHVAKIAEKLSK
jgi:NAD(P)H dehydrogenase (quinone)